MGLRPLLLTFLLLLAACAAPSEKPQSTVMPPSVTGTAVATNTPDPAHGRRRFAELPCAGCHGVNAGGQYGPALAGASLSFEAVREQVRQPRDKMPPFDPERVSDADLRAIHAWLTGLPTPSPTAAVTLPPAQATAETLNRRYPPLDATTLADQMDGLDELTLRVTGEVIAVDESGRFTAVRLRVDDGQTEVEVWALYDTALAGRPFPATAGQQVTVYGVGAAPREQTAADGTTERLPQLQILEVRLAP